MGRQLVDTLRFDDRADRAVLRLKQYSHGLHGNHVRRLSHMRPDAHGIALATLHVEMGDSLRGEALTRDADRISAGRNVRVHMVARFGGRKLLLGAALDVNQDQSRPGVDPDFVTSNGLAFYFPIP